MNRIILADTVRRHGRFYLMEAAGLAGFVALAGSLTTWLEHPALPAMHSWLWHYPLLRRAMLGLAMGAYVSYIVFLFGSRSGTHINPAVTWTFFRLGKIGMTDAILYSLAQFAGALAGFYLVKGCAGYWFAYPSVGYGVSKPLPPYGTAEAFIAEFIISFILMTAMLFMSGSRKWEKYTAPVIGSLLAVFIIAELPYSGMSMNPARSFAAAFGSGDWTHLWIYFVAPAMAMLLAAELFIAWHKRRRSACHTDYREIETYPVAEKERHLA